MTVLAMAAGLLDEFPLGFGAGAADGFAIRNLRLADVGFDAELASHPLHQDFQMQLAHAGNDGLARFLIGVDREGRVFLCQAVQRERHFFLIGGGFRLHCLGDHRLRKFQPFQNDDCSRIA